METTNEENIWSPATYRLKDIIDRVPTLVRVAEGIYGDNESTSFSQGDFIRLDSCAPLQRISAYLAQPGRFIRYEKFGNEINLPYNYNGRVRVQPMHEEGHEYLTVSELIAYFPRYVRIQTKVSFQYPLECDQTLEEGDVLMLKAVQRNQIGVTNSLRCTRFGKDVILPRDLKGRFLVLPDEEEQAIRTVVETYKLPQCVRFIGRGVQEIMSKDLQEAVDNMAAFSGEMIINGKTTSPPVLFGHYKGVGRATSALICRRAAVVIPLHSPQVEDMEVQLPVRKHSDNYEQFLVKVFPAKSEGSSILEDALYADFSTTSNIQFLSSEVQTDDLPQEESESDSSSTSNSPPPLPPRHASEKQIPDDTNKNRPLQIVKGAPFSQAKRTASIPQEGKMSKTNTTTVKPNQTGSFADLNSKIYTLKYPPPLVKAGIQPKPNDPVFKPSLKALVIQQTPPDSVFKPSPKAPPIQQTPKATVVKPMPKSPVIQQTSNEHVATPIPTTKDPVIQQPPQNQRAPLIKATLKAPVVKPTPKRSNLPPSCLVTEAFSKPLPSEREEIIYQMPEEGGIYEAIDEKIESPDIQAKSTTNKKKGKSAFSDFYRNANKPAIKLIRKFTQKNHPDPDGDYDYNRTNNIPISELSVSELRAVLNDCRMPDLARICSQERIDGDLFVSLTPEMMKNPPFSLSNWSIIKAKKIQKGWMPRE